MKKSNLLLFFGQLRQWFYPKEFRIEPMSNTEWAKALTHALNAKTQDVTPKDDTNETVLAAEEFLSQFDGAHLSEDAIIKLCNDLFRIQRDTTLLPEQNATHKELRGVHRTLGNIFQLLQEKGIECLDLTDQDYLPKRVDFTPSRKVQELPGLESVIIAECKRPAIYFQGNLLQKATGIIAKPAKETEQSEVKDTAQPGAVY